MSDREPDFEALARAWVGGDPRLHDLARRDPERAAGLAARLAEALERRRREVSGPLEGDLVVNVHGSRFDRATGLDAEALEALARFLEEAAEDTED